MDDQAALQDIFQLEAVGIEYTVSISSIAQEREQVAGMFGMGQFSRVVVLAGLVEGKGTIACLMDVHSVELAVGRYVFVGQAVYFRLNQHAAKRDGIEISHAVQKGIVCISYNFGISLWIR